MRLAELIALGLVLVAACARESPQSPDGQPGFTSVVIGAEDYETDRFFFYEFPEPENDAFHSTWGVDPARLAGIRSFFVFVTDCDSLSARDHCYAGFAVADLAPGLDGPQQDDAFRSAPATSRWPDAAGVDPNADSVLWRWLSGSEVGWVVGGPFHILGFYLRDRRLRDDEALAVAFVDPNRDAVGEVDEQALRVKLRLIRHPRQNAVTDEATFSQFPTNRLMMRHVYALGITAVTDVQITIESLDPSNPSPATPRNLAQSSYLHMFGLDDLDESNLPNPDGRFDQFGTSRLDREGGYVFMPGLRPFIPRDSVVSARLITAGIDRALATQPAVRDSLFGPAERVADEMYILRPGDPARPCCEYVLRAEVR